MSLLKEFTELQHPVRASLIGIAINMPFWYLSVFLFAKSPMGAYPFEIPIVVAFCLSLFHLLLAFLIAANLQKLGKKGQIERLSKENFEEVFFMSIVISVFVKATVMFTWYRYSKIENLFYPSFFYYATTVFLLTFGCELILAVAVKIKRRHLQKKDKQQTED